MFWVDDYMSYPCVMMSLMFTAPSFVLSPYIEVGPLAINWFIIPLKLSSTSSVYLP